MQFSGSYRGITDRSLESLKSAKIWFLEEGKFVLWVKKDTEFAETPGYFIDACLTGLNLISTLSTSFYLFFKSSRLLKCFIFSFSLFFAILKYIQFLFYFVNF